MPIFLGAGKNAAECRRIVEGRGGEFHVYEFQGTDGVSPFADHAPEIKHPPGELCLCLPPVWCVCDTVRHD